MLASWGANDGNATLPAAPADAWRVVSLPAQHAVGGRFAPAMTHLALCGEPRAISATVDWPAARLHAEAAVASEPAR